MMLNLFASRPDHPLGGARELKRVLAELPPDNAFKAVDEIHGWLESLLSADDFSIDQLFDVVRQLDEAAQPHLRRLSRDYLFSPRLSKAEERRRWIMSYNYWGEVAGLYARCVERARQSPRDKGGEAFRASLPLAAARLMAARTSQLKWVEYRYGKVGEDLWRGLGHPYLAAEAAGYARTEVQLYPGQSAVTSVEDQYLQALAFHASSMGCLRPLEIDLADRLLVHLLPGFSFSSDCRAESAHCVDAAGGSPPVRLGRGTAPPSPTVRFFSSGAAPRELDELMLAVERGKMPPGPDLGGEFSASTVLPVLRHLATYWASEPPLREHERHAVRTRMAVLNGFDDCFTVLADGVARLGKERSAESCVVENVSLGGFGAAVEDIGDWIGVGVLLCMQPEGGDNWVLGIVKRFSRDGDNHATVGIQTLSREAKSVELRPRAAGFSTSGAMPGIWLRDASAAGEVRMLLPSAAFDQRESLEFEEAGTRHLLSPVALDEQGVNFEIGRYREQPAE